jgi:uncharacterized protein YjbJ (UPF0337 family)
MTIKQELKGNWSEQKIKLKARYPSLTDRDLMYAEGKKEEMLNNLQMMLGKPRPALYAMIEAL